MEKTMNERLREFFEKEGIRQTDLVKQFSLTKQTINAWFTGSSSIGTKHLHDLHRAYPHLNMDWLITGRGNPLIGRTPMTLGQSICMECFRKDIQIDSLSSQLNDKHLRIEILSQEIGKLKATKPGFEFASEGETFIRKPVKQGIGR